MICRMYFKDDRIREFSVKVMHPRMSVPVSAMKYALGTSMWDQITDMDLRAKERTFVHIGDCDGKAIYLEE